MEILNSRTILHPVDPERTTAFYRDGLGLAVAREFGSGEGKGTVFFAGGGHIEVVGRRPPGGTGVGGAVVLWLQVRDVAATVAELRSRGVEVVRDPVAEPWGLIEAWVDDPDGVRLILVEVPPDHPLRVDTRSL